MRHPGAVVAGLLCLIQATVQAQSYNPDLWPVTSGDSIEAYLDARLFDDTAVPAGIEAVLDRQGNLAVVRCGEVPGLVESSAHVLDFAAGQAYHIRPAHSLASAAFSPDQSHIAAVLSAPCDGCLVIYSMVDGEARRIEGVQAVPGSVTWLNADRISYLPELDGKAAAEPVEVDLTQAETGRVFGNPAPGGNLQPEVYSCGGTNDDCICGMNNPYPCCDNGGNCTWWAWHAACCNWGVGCPGWGNAHSWLGNAQASGYPTTSTPTVGSIACDSNNTLSSYGHVVWVLQVSGSSILVSEQSCGGFYGSRQYWYASWIFDGYILNPSDPCAGTDDAIGTWESWPYDYDTVLTGQVFNKSWTMQNTGSSTWSRDCNHKFAFDGGTQFGVPGWTDLASGETIAPGQSKTWTLTFTAPSTPGQYQGYFRMDRYGVGRFGARPFILVNVVSPTGDLTGTVTNASTSAPIPGAAVTLSGVGNTTTNGSGVYTFNSVAGGSYTVSVSATGYNPASDGVTITGGNTTTKNFALTPSDTQAPTIPTGLTAQATSPTSVQLNWTVSTDDVGVAGYDIRRNGSVVGSSATASYLDNGASPGTDPVYDVRARDSVPNYSDWSASVTVHTPPNPPALATVFSDGFDGNLNNWTQQVAGFAYSTTVNRGGLTGAGAAFVAAGEADQMYKTFTRPFAQGTASGYFWDGKGGWKAGTCGWQYRQSLSLRETGGTAGFILDNCLASNVGAGDYFYRYLCCGWPSAYTSIGARDVNTDCGGTWVQFQTTITPDAPGAGGSITLKVTDRAGAKTATPALDPDFFNWGIGRITLGLGVTSAYEGYWDDITFEAMPPDWPIIGTATALSPTQIRWNFTPRDNNLFGWDVLDTANTILSPQYPAAGWLNRAATSWTETGLTANTVYTRKVRAWNGTLNGAFSETATACTLSLPPEAGTIVADNAEVCMGESVTWSTTAGFGPGTTAYYRYAWDQTPAYSFTGEESHWDSGTLVLQASAAGPWYLHIQSCNDEGQPSGTFTYSVTATDCTVIPQVIASVSRKVHGDAGTFDIDVDVSTAIEGRANGPTLVVVTFSDPIEGLGGLDPGDVAASSGSVTHVSIDGPQLAVELSDVADGSLLAISFPGIVGLGGSTASPDVVCFGVLGGDANGDGATNVFDLVSIRNQLNTAPTATTFRCDTTADGLVNIFDLVMTRNNLNHSVTGSCP
ncbi:MAG: CHAP domain-containing protein [Phycisphaerae bacterium]|nr:CHAP domain-containing protein [Phycisphaerae bacterium]